MKYPHVVAEFCRKPWALLPDKLHAIAELIALNAAGGKFDREEVMERIAGTDLLAGAVPHDKSEGKDDSGAWDGPAAVERLKKWASSDGSGDKDKMNWSKYERGFAWVDSADKESFGSYKLPHHDIQGGKFVVVLRGVEAAMSALLGGRGGTTIPESDRKAVYDHLAAEYREFDKEPPPYHTQASVEFLAASKLAGRPGTVAMIPIYGVISHRAGLMTQISGGTSIDKLTASFRQAMQDPSVKAIVFDVDSPGGAVDGVEELASEIGAARGQKKTIAVSNTMAASAAYWLASSAEQFVVTPSGSVGSIGVWAAHEDLSKALEAEGVKVSMISAGKYKTEGNPYEPLSEEGRASMQAMVDDYYGRFVKAVADNRGKSQTAVRNGFGQGRMVLSSEALKEGMVDQVATLDQVLARLGVGQNPNTSTRVARNLQERELALYK